MVWINAPNGRICNWGIPLAEAYGVRLSADYESSGYELDFSQDRVFYFYHDRERFFKYVRQVRKSIIGK